MSRLMYLMIILIALIGGAGLAAQPGVNATLSRKMGHPLHAAIISFGSGFLVLVVIAILSGRFPPRFTDSISSLPWWAWAGGSIGAYLVTMSMIFAPRVGALQWIALIVTGQAFASLLLDHFGLAGFNQRGINVARLLGALLLVAGLILSSIDTRPKADATLPTAENKSDNQAIP
ncbi:MAG: DMT family transporter [Pirellulaceae bacterium]